MRHIDHQRYHQLTLQRAIRQTEKQITVAINDGAAAKVLIKWCHGFLGGQLNMKSFQMLEHMEPILSDAEAAARHGDLNAALNELRRLCLDDFGLVLLNMPNKSYPKLSRLLPAMASDETQQAWTGASGIVLLRQSLNFVRIVAHNYAALTGRNLEGASTLDYGCGYGRLIRLLYYFSDNEDLSGCDPWDQSISLCTEAGISCGLDVTDYLPQSLPYEPNSFDLICAFSVFTHTSLRATKCALDVLRQVVKSDGLIAITIRPIEYWSFAEANGQPVRAARLEKEHKKAGFAFAPHNRTPVDGDITYGDTSMTLNKLQHLAEGMQIVGYERSLDDAFQIIVFLKCIQN